LGASKRALLVSVILIVCATMGTVVALRSFGAIQIGYNVVPSTQAPTLNPNPIQVSLATWSRALLGARTSGRSGP